MGALRYGSVMIDVQSYQLGVSSEPLNLESSEDNRAAAVALVRQARRSLDIYTRDFDKAIYDEQTFIDAVRALALRTRQQTVRVLVKDSRQAVKYGHRLIPLSQRLTSFIEIRKPPDEYREYNEALLIVDDIGYIQRKLADRYEGRAYFNASNEARRLLAFFDEVWRVSAVDADLRRLHL